MKPNVLALALVTAATALPGSANAADDFCSRLFIYAVNQICQLLPNGQAICQPVGLAGPGPGASCDSPSTQQMVQIPLGQPNIQMMPFTPNTTSYGPNPFILNPFTPNPFTPNPFSAMPFAANTYPPFPFAPNLFGPNPSAPVAAKAPMNAQPASPTPPQVQAPVLPLVAAAPVKPVAESAPTPQAEKATAKPMPETPPVVSSAVVAKATPPAPVAKAAPEATPAVAPKAPEPVKAIEVAASPAVIAPELPSQKAPLTSKADVSAMTPASKPAIEIAAPLAVSPAAEVAPSPANAVPAIDAEAAAKAEKAIQDALAHFEFDSAELTPVGRAMLDSWLANTPRDAAIRVTGHADRLGPEPYNDKLSLLRAEAVKKYLTEKGKPVNRIQILAKGEGMPVISCAGDANPETKSCLAPNRRAEIAAKPEVKPAAKSVAHAVTKTATKQKPKATVKTKPAINKSAR
jgi:OOP family OmpA-OmpF porin